MIYELAIIAREHVGEEFVTSLTNLVNEVVGEAKGEILISDDWGAKTFAQPTKRGVTRGHYYCFLISTEEDCNEEMTRRLKINEDVLKMMIVKLGSAENQETIVKHYKTPFSKKYSGSVTDDLDEAFGEMGKERRRFARRKTCWFTVKKIRADWKDPATYSWLINEFGKIAPSRISGINRKHQRFVTVAVKRARQLGIVSHLSNRFAD